MIYMNKRILFLAALLLSGQLYAQGPLQNILHRFDDEKKGKVVFIPKGIRTLGISGSYHSYDAAGLANGDGFSILSMLNIGSGRFQTWTVAPRFSYFLADDFALGVRLEYAGYNLNTDLKLDLRDALGSILNDLDSEQKPETIQDLNVQITSRHMHHHRGGISLTARKYLSFFGSQLFAVFAEGRLFGNYGVTTSHPLKSDENYQVRVSSTFGTGLKFAVGGALKLRDGSSFFLSIPLVGITYENTIQDKSWMAGTNNARMSSFRVARDLDLLGIQIGYFRVLDRSKKKPKPQPQQ